MMPIGDPYIDMTEKMARQYQMLAECIRSGQVNARDVIDLFRQRPTFKAWYLANYG